MTRSARIGGPLARATGAGSGAAREPSGTAGLQEDSRTGGIGESLAAVIP